MERLAVLPRRLTDDAGCVNAHLAMVSELVLQKEIMWPPSRYKCLNQKLVGLPVKYMKMQTSYPQLVFDYYPPILNQATVLKDLSFVTLLYFSVFHDPSFPLYDSLLSLLVFQRT